MLDNKITALSPMQYIVAALVLLFPTACLLIDRGDSIVFGILALLGFWVGFRDGLTHALKREDWILAAAFFAFFAVATLSYEYGQQTDEGFRFLGRDLRFLLVVPVLMLFRRYPPPAKIVFIGLGIGGLLTGVYVLIGFHSAGSSYRAQAQTDLPVIFGDLTTCIVLTLAAAYGLVVAERKWWFAGLYILCLLFGLISVALSETRGAWVALLLLLPFLFHGFDRVMRRRYLLLILLSILILFSAAFFLLKPVVRNRVQQVSTQISLYKTYLQYMQEGKGGYVPVVPLCNDQRDFLQSWLSLSSGRSELSTEVLPDPTLSADRHLGVDCKDGYALRITSADQYGWVTFPRAVLNKDATQTTDLILRGKGTVYLYDTNAEKVSVDFPQYKIVTLHGEVQSGASLVATLMPHQVLWLVPVDTYFGEYQHALLMNTSVGLRLEMWRVAWHMFLNHPFLGVGTGAFDVEAQRLAQAGMIPPPVANFDHAHSDYFDALSSRGLLGLLALLAILLVPAAMYQRAVNSSELTRHVLGLAGLLLVSGFAIFGLTDTVFIHSMNISWYVIYIAIFQVLAIDRKV